jgi:hypothetical protein
MKDRARHGAGNCATDFMSQCSKIRVGWAGYDDSASLTDYPYNHREQRDGNRLEGEGEE